MKEIIKARNAILGDLARRFQAGDKTVLPLDALRLRGWHKPLEQPNCFSGAGKMPCPICGKGTLNYSRAACNGHVWATCSTPGCVHWME